jgi:4a-hydroxytetrahydrobiopterin dehydratase
MDSLRQLKCVPCRGDSPRLTDEEISQYLPQVAQWNVIEQEGIKRLQRVFKVKNFARALELTLKVGELAEQEDHHPSLLTEWGKVTVTWWTHAIKGLHLNDFIMATKTDDIYDRLNV